MFKAMLARLQQGHRTIKYPDGPPPELPDRWRGKPVLKPDLQAAHCHPSAQACPTGAFNADHEVSIDLGKCLFCGQCAKACPREVTFSRDYQLGVRQRKELVVSQSHPSLNLEAVMGIELKKLFGRSLKLRQVSAGGCNACEADTNVLGTLAWDLGRFGIQFVASPRHADGLLITGPVTKNMELALKKTYQAVPEPKIVIAVGACAISGGPYFDHPQVKNGADAVVPVDLYIPGCPPHPLTILDGLLRFMGYALKNPSDRQNG